jgi:Uma2 family endonuclease
MSTAHAHTEPIVLHFGSVLRGMSDDDFLKFCRRHPDYRMERTAEGDLIVMPPTGGETGRQNFALTAAFGDWVDRDGSGVGFDSSTGFHLPNGADRSPDLAWVRRARWEVLTPEQRKSFPPLCPHFVLELRYQNDSLDALQPKMQEYIGNGARLGWLIDPQERVIYVYRPGAPVSPLRDPESISGDPEPPGFSLDMRRIWG